MTTLANFTDVLFDEICNSQPLSLSSSVESRPSTANNPCYEDARVIERPPKGTGMRGQFRCTEEIDQKYRSVFAYPYFNLVQSSVIEDALYSDKSVVVCAPTGSGKTVVFEMAIVQLLMELDDKQYSDDFKIIYMAPVKALCTERLTEWYPKFTKLGLLCIEVTGDTDVDFTQLKPYKIIITTPEKWDMLTRRWRDHRGLVEVIKLFLIDEVHILNDETRGPVLEAVVSRMKTIESSAQSAHRIEQLQKEMQGQTVSNKSAPRIRFVAVSATVSNPEDVASWLGTRDKPAVFYKFGDECRPVKLKRVVEGYPCAEGTSIFKFDIILNYKLWPIIQKYHSGKPTLIFCNTRKSVVLTAETLSKELTINFNAEQKAKLTAVASSIKNKRLQALVMSGVGVHHAGLLYEERQTIEYAFRNRDLPILITTTTLAMGVNLPAHLVIVKNTQQYVSGAYQEYSISTVLQMVGRAGRPQFDTEATAVIMTRLVDKPRYQALVGGCEPLQSYLHKRLAENLNSEAALGTVSDVAQCVQWLRSTFLYVRAARDPKKYLSLPQNSPQHLISKKIEELCVKAMNGLASSGLITMDEASCIESTEAGRLMSIFYLDLETMKQIMKINGTESLERLLVLICESHELADMHLRVDERRCLNLLNRNNAAATIRFPMKGKITTRQMKLNCVIQAVLGCLSIPDPSLNQEAMKIMRIADRICKCLVIYVTRPDLISQQPQFFSAVLNSILLAKCVAAHLWENSPFVSKQLKGIGPTFSTLLASAGKINFMLLEESHPRDLERIMNKGPPAGNVLRKQVSLLPKYQLTMIPVDEKTVTVQLVLLNKSHLAENMENLTAGDSHKSYIIVGDSNNNLLLLVAFKDRDLISVFDGIITHVVMRKHSFEHKIFAHSVSSNFVGIDVQSEYMFNDLEPFLRGLEPGPPVLTNAMPTKKTAERQTCITDTFKERKRKVNPDAIEKSKEKRKRENGIMENFKYLKQSFETASKNINRMHKQNEENFKIDTGACASSKTMNNTNTININSKKEKVNILDKKTCFEEMDSDEFIDDEKIDSILNEIENEMGKNKLSIDNAEPLNNNNPYTCEKYLNVPNPFSTKLTAQNPNTKLNSNKKLNVPRKCKPKTAKSNYTFIELLERNLSLSDDEEKAEAPQNNNGFSDTIRSQIQKYLTKAQTKTVIPDRNIKILLDKSEDGLVNEDKETQEVKTMDLDSEILNSPTQSNYPRYEIKEILGGQHFTQQNNKKNSLLVAKVEENLICNPDSQNCDILTSVNNTKEDGTKTSDIEMEDSMALYIMNTVIIDDEDDRNNSDMREENLNDTLILNFDETSKIFRNQENAKNEVDNCNKNELDDIIYVEEYNFKQDNDECRKNVPILDLDVIMIDPSEVSIENTNRSDRNMNDQRSVANTNNFAYESTITERSPNYVILHNNKFQDKDSSEKDPCSDVALKDQHQNFERKNPTQDKSLAILDIRHDLVSTEMDTIAKNPCSDISLKDGRYLVPCNIPWHDKKSTVKENIGRNPYKSSKAEGIEKNLSSNIILKNKQFTKNYRESHKENRAIEDNNINPYELTNLNDLVIMPCPNKVSKERNQLVGNNRVLTTEDNNIGHNLYEPTRADIVPKIPSSDTIALKDENQRVRYNRPTQDRTLPIEYAGYTTEYTCQAQCNKSICYPPVSSVLYPTYNLANNSQHKLGNSSKNVEHNKQKTEYVKRYTYSASKVDVCTKQTPDFCVQVIKKVKMDLDITAIVSRKHNSTQNYKADCEETSTNNKRMKLIKLPKEDKCFQNTAEDANNIIATDSNEIENKSTVNLTSVTLSRPECPRVKNAFKPPYKTKSEEESKYTNLQMTNTNKEYRTRKTVINENQSNQHNEIKNSEIVREELEKQDNDDYGETDKKLREPESGNNPVIGDNKIKNLLQKYRKILTQNAVKTITSSCSDINRTVVAGGPVARKSQKPFKITDIHKLHATLPETIVNNKPEIETNISQSPKVNRCFESKNRREDVNFSKYAQITENKHAEKIPEHESVIDFELEPIHLDNNIDLEPSKEYNIDQSMFDPKTLLQSVAGDDSDEIVPPPPEFCDDITYSSSYDSEKASMAEYSVTQRAPELNMFTENNMEYNESIFDDCSAKNLSSCTEIETWNLSREDSWEPCNVMNLSPSQSFRIVRKNTKNDFDFMQNSEISRQERLKKFRFHQKNKLKIRK